MKSPEVGDTVYVVGKISKVYPDNGENPVLRIQVGEDQYTDSFLIYKKAVAMIEGPNEDT